MQPEPSTTETRKTATLDELSRHIDDLPLLPQALANIMRLNPDAGDYFEELERHARAEPAFAVRIIAMANSAASRPVKPITSLSMALLRHGGARIRSLVASLAVQQVFVPTTSDHFRLWVHSIQVAVAAETLARTLRELKLEAADAYLAGLLHDIGRFVMFEHAAANLQQVDESHWHSAAELVEADLEVFKFTHSELGHRACRRWGIPDPVTEVVRTHHQDIVGKPLPGSPEALNLCVQVADHFSIAVLSRDDVRELPDADLETLIRETCVRCRHQEVLIPTRTLVDKARRILDESAQILDGLGIPG